VPGAGFISGAVAAGLIGVIIGAGLVSAGGGVAGAGVIVAAGGLSGLIATGAAGAGATAFFSVGATLGLDVIAGGAGWALISVGIVGGFFAGGGVAGAGVIVAAGGLCGSIATGATGVRVGSDVVVLVVGVVGLAAGIVAVVAGIVGLAAGVVAVVTGVVALAGAVLVAGLLDCAFTAPGEVTTTGGAWVSCLSNSAIFCSKAARRAACIGVSFARTEMKLAQKTAAQTVGNNLGICMTFLYAYFPPDATAFPVVENNFCHAPGRG
jgi:hypothetical protein